MVTAVSAVATEAASADMLGLAVVTAAAAISLLECDPVGCDPDPDFLTA
jgi:hypothetical protein